MLFAVTALASCLAAYRGAVAVWGGRACLTHYSPSWGNAPLDLYVLEACMLCFTIVPVAAVSLLRPGFVRRVQRGRYWRGVGGYGVLVGVQWGTMALVESWTHEPSPVSRCAALSLLGVGLLWWGLSWGKADQAD